MDTKPFLPYDCTRCRNETCADRDSCLRYLARDEIGPRTPIVVWNKNPENKMECGMYQPWRKNND